MLGRITKAVSLCIAALAAAVVATPSQATPAFARQADKACSTCHFQHYPALNDYGQEFKAGGFTQMGKQSVLKGKDLSLASILNASIFTKIRYQKNNGRDLANESTVASGELQFPDEFALLFGGRVTENIGYMLEGQLANGDAAFLAGFKLPTMFPVGADMKAGVVPYTTDALGASYGFELLSTGAVRNIRIMEHRNESSAQQYIGTATAASGAAFVLWSPKFFVNVSKWSPNHIAVAEGRANGNPSANYLRAAVTPSLGDWSLGFGVQKWSGSSKVDETADPAGSGVCARADGTAGTTLDCRTEATAVDAQAQGVLGTFPVGVYLTHARAPGTAAGETPNLFNANPNSKRATVIATEVGIIPNKVTLMFAYRNADNGRNATASRSSKDNSVTLGATYQYAQNVQLQLQHSTRTRENGYQGSDLSQAARGDRLTTLMLSAGF
jgi:hypothetical protein